MTSISTYISSKELFANLALRDLRAKYKRSFLGWTWSLANPLANMIVYTIVFKYFLKQNPRPGDPSGLNVYALFLLCALLPWNFFQTCVMGSLGSLTGNASLIKKSYFPRELLPAATVGSNLVSHMIEMGLLLVALVAFGNWRAIIYLPFVLLLTVLTGLFAFGLGLALSAINVYFRDVEHFMGILFLAWLYLTPIIYPFSVIPAKYADIVKLNPMTDMSLCYRAAWYDGRIPGMFELGYYAAWAIAALVVGLVVFNRLESGLAEEAVTDRPLAVEAVNVSKRFRLIRERNASLKATILRGRRVVSEDFWALRDVSFEVYQGETFGLIGENGSGKSTMLKCLTKILRPTEGTVAVNGKVSALLELGAGFHPELSGRENVYLNGAILGLSQKELRRRFDGIVEFAGVGAFIDEPVKNYSSGMYVRLGFSVAINVDPDVLLVDEVLTVGDENFQRKCNEKFTELRNEGKTIVLVTHGMDAVQNMCHRAAWFSHGRLMMVGPPREVIEAYTDTVEVDRQVDSDGHARSGSGEARVTDIVLLDGDGCPVTKLHSGGPARFRVMYEATEAVERPVFNFSIRTLDGFEITAPNNRDADRVPEKIIGSGQVEVTFDYLRLLPGTYDLTVAISDFSGLRPYDLRKDVLRFDVERGSLYEQGGVVSLGGTWAFEGDGTS